MLQLEHKKLIVDACCPESQQEALELWHDIKPIKFGNGVTWTAGVFHELATYQIPLDAAYLLILRTECYAYTNVAAAPGFRNFEPPPTGIAYWQYSDVAGGSPLETRLTPNVPIHLLCDSDEFLIATGDYRIVLQAELSAPPDANARIVRTLVYGYLIGALVAGKIGDSESTYFGV